MRLIDRALPAAQYLVGPDAIDVLRVPIEATGGHVESAHPVQVQYRPGSDVVVRYSAQVAWSGSPAIRETLVAASTGHGSHPGAVPVTATVPGGPLTVGVWRWPFDPMLPGLAGAVTPESVAQLLDVDPTGLSLEVMAFRPTDRAVVKVERDHIALAYLKVVAPHRAGDIARRHSALHGAGVPVARVLSADLDQGLLVLEALHGSTLRELVKQGAPGWPAPAAFTQLVEGLASAELVQHGPASRLADGPPHAQMLAAVLPDLAGVLDELGARFEAFVPAPIDGIVHGDLHEGQVIIDDGRIVGVLDIDDAGQGSTVDDWANLIARFRFRAVTMASGQDRMDRYASSLRDAALARHDAERLDMHTAAALIGLATGPFRIQSSGWRGTVHDVVDLAGELSMRRLSA